MFQSLIERQHVSFTLLRQRNILPRQQSHAIFAAFPCLLHANMIHQDAPHELRRYREEMCSVLPLKGSLIHQPETRLLHQFGGLKGMIRSLAGEAPARQATKFVINEGNEFLSRLAVTLTPTQEQLCDLVR